MSQIKACDFFSSRDERRHVLPREWHMEVKQQKHPGGEVLSPSPGASVILEVGLKEEIR